MQCAVCLRMHVVYMYVCVCIYICILMYVCMYVCTNTHAEPQMKVQCEILGKHTRVLEHVACFTKTSRLRYKEGGSQRSWS